MPMVDWLMAVARMAVLSREDVLCLMTAACDGCGVFTFCLVQEHWPWMAFVLLDGIDRGAAFALNLVAKTCYHGRDGLVAIDSDGLY